MSTSFYSLKIKSILQTTPDAVCIEFDVPENLQDHFYFESGQYLTLKATIGEQEIRRSYSLCSSPSSKSWKVGIKKVTNGLFSSFANDILKTGDTLEVMPPMGKFKVPDCQENTDIVFFAAGSGITPILSQITDILETQARTSCTLVYSNRNKNSIMFKEELEALKDKYLQRLRLIHLLSREKTDSPLHFGRIDQVKLATLFKHLLPKDAAAYMICGPEEMILATKNYLQEIGIPPAKVMFELFGTSAGKTKHASAKKSEGSKVGSHITLILDGRSVEMNVAFDDQTILDAALEKGADLPYACKGGVCCTCKAKLIEGEVEMEVHYGLEQDEIEHGFILTCQSRPLTETVVIDFDAK